MNRISNLIYFNNNRTTQIDETVLECMNAISISNESKEIILTKAKVHLGTLLNADPEEILLTSGTTESINLLIRTAFEFYKHKGKHIITNSTEHFATLDCLKELESKGAEVTVLGVNRE